MVGVPGTSKDRQLANVALDPLVGGAIIATSFTKHLFGPTDISATVEALEERARAIRENKLASAEDMLTGQAAALNALFLELARRSGANMGEYMSAAETYMRLALKAQAQCRATLETLATIKNPPVIHARQANIAAGPQQVNNGPTASPARKLKTCRTNYWRQAMNQPDGPWNAVPNNRQRIPRWKPWERSTGPRTAAGKVKTSRNADKGGRRKALRAELAGLRELIRELDAERRTGV